MIACFWSTDPSFYELVVGSPDPVKKPIIKVNCLNIDLIINQFAMTEHKSTDGCTIYKSKSNEFEYLCIRGSSDIESFKKRISEILPQ